MKTHCSRRPRTRLRVCRDSSCCSRVSNSKVSRAPPRPPLAEPKLTGAYLDRTAAARLKGLRQQKADQLAALERKWRSAVVQLDDQLRLLTLGDFIDKYNSSRDDALRQIVQHTIKRAPMGDEELNRRSVCPSSRLDRCDRTRVLMRLAGPFRRKRNAPGSPRRGGQPAGSSIEDVFGTQKKARPAAPPSARKAVPGSATAQRASTAAGRRTRDNSPTTVRRHASSTFTSRMIDSS